MIYGGLFEWCFQNNPYFRILLLLLLICPYKVLWLQSLLSGLNSI
ncbi:hypothetical protein HMPREF1421_01160 [Helicobacter pylori GAM265BSii]|uniref:Uncharacterized protein n=1 Tax=Helicobacter pylori GAM265BSii TaxID=1159049 RepID=M3NHU2_HELPX|nr:hypothetical protein HMPREF1421_01160 [Helicobacter pylori GAM265BSii]